MCTKMPIPELIALTGSSGDSRTDAVIQIKTIFYSEVQSEKV